jgi:hypothetical protein
MTPKRLTELIVKGDRAKLCEELAPLDEKQRTALAETAAALHRRIDVKSPTTALRDCDRRTPTRPADHLVRTRLELPVQ